MQLPEATPKTVPEQCSDPNLFLAIGRERYHFSPACCSTMPQQQIQGRLTDAEMARGVGMLEAGLSQRQVAQALNVNQSVISRMWNRYQTTGNVSRRHSGGRTRITTLREDRFLVMQASRHPFWTATQLQNDLQHVNGARISTETVRRRLHEAGLRSRVAAIRIPLTQQHRQARLTWAQQHATCTIADWTPVLFTDESRFCLDMTDRRQRVWRRRNQRFLNAHIAQLDRYGGGSLMVWAGISVQGKTDFHVLQNGTLTAVRYRDEILDPIVRPYAGAIGPHFILMDDNARPHRAHLVDQYLDNESIERMEWPSRSPDLNPIEHVWDMIGRAVYARVNPPCMLAELGQALQEEYDRIPQQKIRNLICSTRRRCQAVIDARGCHTRY